MHIDLTDRVAVVTGASSGLGAAIATGLAESGARVVLVGRNEERLRATAAAVEAHGGAATVVAKDLREAGAAEELVAQVIAEHGHLEILVNAAGVFEIVPLDGDPSAFDRQWEINVRAAYAVTRAATATMSDGGAVLFLSSVGGMVGFAPASGYCASKGAVENLVRALALELAPRGIRVNAIAPGNIRTAMNEDLLADPGYEAAMLERTPLGRIGVPADIVPTSVLLVSDAAAYVTGARLAIDGGWTAQ